MTGKSRNINVVIILLLLSATAIIYYVTHGRYSQEKWKNKIDRSSMVTSIIYRELLDKRSYNETIEELGPPDLFKGLKTRTKDTSTLTLVYLTGGEQKKNAKTLCVDFKNDTVVKVYIDQVYSKENNQ